MEIRPVTADRFADLADLFESNSTTRGCWCMYFRMPRKECSAGWGSVNRSRLEQAVADDHPPTDLLTAAVELAGRRGVPAIEGWPLAGAGPHSSDRYYGTEPLFEACGFTCIARPTPNRAVMRRELTAGS